MVAAEIEQAKAMASDELLNDLGRASRRCE
jgi:hypothetical protein